MATTADKGSLLHRIDHVRHLCCLVCRATCITFIVRQPALSEVIACKAEDVGRHHSLRAGSALAIRSAGQVNLLDRIVLLIKSKPSRRASSKGGAITHGSTGLSPSRKLISTARASSMTQESRPSSRLFLPLNEVASRRRRSPDGRTALILQRCRAIDRPRHPSVPPRLSTGRVRCTLGHNPLVLLLE